MTQLALNWAPPVERLPLPDPRIVREARPRLHLQSIAILARLKEGPATNGELGKLAQRFGARVMELRDAGHVIHQEYVSQSRGVYRYELLEQPRERCDCKGCSR